MRPSGGGIEGFTGYWASGKTMAMCARVMERQRNDPGLIVGSNFGYKRGEVYNLRSIEEIMAFASTDFGRPKLIAIDEIGSLLRARGASTWPPAGDTVFQQGRKLKCEMMWTTQHWRLTDVNVRRVTSRVTMCSGHWQKRITKRRERPEEWRPRWFRQRQFDAPNPECGELPVKCTRARWVEFDQRVADSYDTMHLVECALEVVKAQQAEAAQMSVIREALMASGMSVPDLEE